MVQNTKEMKIERLKDREERQINSNKYLEFQKEKLKIAEKQNLKKPKTDNIPKLMSYRNS